EVFGHQELQLLLGVLHRIGGGFRVFDFAGGGSVFRKDGGCQAGDLVSNQREATTAFLHAAVELLCVGGQGVEQKGAVHGHVQNLAAQFFLRTQRHVSHGHLLQVGQVFF